MNKVIRDAKGKSWEEHEIRNRISQGERVIDARLVLQLLEDMETMRREVYVDKALDLTNAIKRQEINDLNQLINLKQRAYRNE